MKHLLGILLLCLLGPSALADQWQSHESIREAAAAAARAHGVAPGGRVTAVVDELDSRIRLAACGEPLEVDIPYAKSGRARITTQVRCSGPRSWKLHVPVRLTVFQPVVVVTRAIPRDTLLTADDIQLAERDTGSLDYGYLTAIRDAVGQRLRRPLAAGEAVAPGYLAMAPLVRRGQKVTLNARGGGMNIRMAGIAQADGVRGQVIPVQNISSGREVEAIVRSAKSVEVLLR